jgi:hypothetical protein
MRIAPVSYKNDSAQEEALRSKDVGLSVLTAIENSSWQMVKTASSSSAVADLLTALAKVLSESGVDTNLKDSSDLVDFAKTAVSKSSEDEHQGETIRIASKQIQDSHYFMDICSDTVTKNDKSLIMVSFLMREGYLGRYLIKRNFFYLPGHGSASSDTYSELVRKAKRVRDRYHSATIATYDILPETKSFLDGIKGDFEDKQENSLGTTVARDSERYHEASGPPYIGYSGHK